MHATRPREHAARIAELTTLEARQRAIADVPSEFQAMVKTHLKIIFMFRKAGRSKWQ